MDLLIKFLVCFVAGIGAGLGTGFAGMSAAAVISPMLITFLGMDLGLRRARNSLGAKPLCPPVDPEVLLSAPALPQGPQG